MRKLLVWAIALSTVACTQDIEEHNKKQAEIAASNRPKSKIIKIETALPGGTTLACETLLDATKLGELMGETDPITLSDQTKKGMGPTSVCSVQRGGTILDAEAQEEQVKKTGRLGVQAGDELCNVEVHCSLPAEDETFKRDCQQSIEKGDRRSNEDIGTYACIKTTPKGPHDAYTYKFIDPDTRCIMSVRGGPSVNEESDVQKCAKAVLELVGPEQLQTP
jgi:hypothetical protein